MLWCYIRKILFNGLSAGSTKSKIANIQSSKVMILLYHSSIKTLFKNSRDFNSTLITKQEGKKKDLSRQEIFSILNKRLTNKWTEEEIRKLNEAISIYGNKWKYISETYFQSSRKPKSLPYILYRLKQLMNESYSFKYNRWTEEEDKILREGIEKYGVGKWKKISELMQTRNRTQIANRWHMISMEKRGRWTKKEDELLLNLVKKYGPKFSKISEDLGRPCGNISKRYMLITSDPWTLRDNAKLRDLVGKFGAENWDKIMEYFPNRAVSEVKHHFRGCSSANPNINLGEWSDQEIFNFIDAFKKFGKNWCNVSKIVGTRSPFQCHKFWRNHIKMK